MHYSSSQLVSFDGQSGEVDIRTELPPADAVAGASVLLRQLASHDELGSFTRVRELIGQLAHSTNDPDREARLELLKAWHEAHKELRNHPLKAMAHRKIFAELGKRSIDDVAWEDVVGGTERPDDLLSLFNYGEVIHWGDHAEALESLDPLLRAHKQWLYLETFWTLSNFYLGYAGLVRAAIGKG